MHVIISILLVIVVLIQPSKGGDLGSIFGGGTSESIFGSSGAVPFLVKLTRILAFLFMVTSLTLGYFSTKQIKSSVIEDTASIQEEITPTDEGKVPEDISTTAE